MRRLKQFAALFIIIATVASMLIIPATVSAEEILPAVKITEKDNLLVEKLKTIGAITGEYSPASYVTRRQMAKIIREYMNLPDAMTGSGKSQFNDVPTDDPDFNTIDILYDLEVISGDENRNFRPDEYVNYNEAVVFIINAVGHKYFALREGGYPTGYMRIAIKHNMLKNINMTNGEADVPVIDIYKMLDGALTAATVVPQYYGDGSVRYTISETENFLLKTYGISRYRGKVTGNEYTCFSYREKDITDEQIVIDGKVYDTPGCFYGYFLGYTVNYYAKYDKETGYYTVLYVEEVPKMNKTFSIDSEDILRSEVTDTRIYYKDENKEKEYIELDGVIDVVYNGQFYADYVDLEDIMPANGLIEALDNNGNGDYDVLFIYDYETVIVESVDTYEEQIVDKITGVVIELSEDVKKVNIISAEDGMPVYLESIAVGDVLNVAISRGTEKVMTIYVNDKVINGQIVASEDGPIYEINGEQYKVSYNYIGEPLVLGLSGTFYLDMNDKIATYKYSAESDNSAVAVVAGMDYKESGRKRNLEVKLFTSAGEFVIVPLKEKVRIDNRRYDLTDSDDFDDVLAILSKGFAFGEKYSINDAYIVRYTLSVDNEIETLDTGDVGGAGNLNVLADEYTFMANRSNMLYLRKVEMQGDTKVTLERLYTRLSADCVTFMVPEAGDLSNERDFSIVTKLKSDHCYADDVSKDPSNFPGSTTTVIENFTAYDFGTSQVPVVDVLLMRGGGVSVGADSSMAVLTKLTNSADADGFLTKTLYNGDEKIGQLAENVIVSRGGTTTDYRLETLIASNILKTGSVIGCSINNENKITEIQVYAEYNNGTLVPLFAESETYIKSSNLWSGGTRNYGVGTIDVYDADNKLLQFTCGEYTLLGDMNYSPKVKIYDSTTNEVRVATPANIRAEDQCVICLNLFYRVTDIIIFR